MDDKKSYKLCFLPPCKPSKNVSIKAVGVSPYPKKKKEKSSQLFIKAKPRSKVDNHIIYLELWPVWKL